MPLMSGDLPHTLVVEHLARAVPATLPVVANYSARKAPPLLHFPTHDNPLDDDASVEARRSLPFTAFS
jgi:hypothetical protein